MDDVSTDILVLAVNVLVGAVVAASVMVFPASGSFKMVEFFLGLAVIGAGVYNYQKDNTWGESEVSYWVMAVLGAGMAIMPWFLAEQEPLKSIATGCGLIVAVLGVYDAWQVDGDEGDHSGQATEESAL